MTTNALDALTEPRAVVDPAERVILAGDMALEFGLAIGSTTEGLIASTHFDAGPTRRKYGIGRAAKWTRKHVEAWASEYVYGIDLVAFEEPAMHGRSAHGLAQFAMVTALLEAGDTLGTVGNSISYWPSNVKKRATNDGAADKLKMKKFAGAYAHRTIMSDDEADAILILKIAIEDEKKRLKKAGA